MLVSDSDEAVLLSNLRPSVSGQALKRSRRNARFASDGGCPISPAWFLSCFLWSKHLGCIRKWSIIFATPPEMVQQNRQLAGHSNHGTLFSTFGSASGQFHAPPP